MASGKKWRESDTIKFVQLYENAECLWNYRHPDYRNRNSRDSAILHIIHQMNLRDFGVYEVKNKIKNIRSTYQQVVNKIKRSKTAIGGDNILEEYKTNLAWFPIADRFLRSVINCPRNLPCEKIEVEEPSLFQNGESSVSDLVKTEISEEIDQDEEEKFSPSYISLDHLSTIHHIEDSKDDSNSFSQQYTKKRKINQQHHEYHEPVTEFRQEDLDITSMDSNQGDEWYFFGNNVACQLRNMPLGRALVSQKRIMDILTEERIGALTREDETQRQVEGGK